MSYMICIIILFLINSFIVINKVKFITNTRHDKVRSEELVLCTLITSVFRVLLGNK